MLSYSITDADVYYQGLGSATDDSVTMKSTGFTKTGKMFNKTIAVMKTLISSAVHGISKMLIITRVIRL